VDRPTSVTVFGILNIVFAALGFMGIGFAILMMFAPAAFQAKNPVLDLMRQSPALTAYTNISTVIGAAFVFILVAAGIGLLMFRPWGRILSIVYGIYTIASVLVSAAVNYCFLLTPLLEKQAALPPGPEKAGAIGGIIGVFIGPCFGLIYPIVLLIFMYRPNVVAALGRQDDALSSGPRWPPP
jgi:hypothetical protein